MVIEAQERHTISVGDVDLVRVRFNDRLDTSELLTGTPTVTEVTTTDLTIANKALNNGTYIDSEGVTVIANQAVQFTVTGGTAAKSPYTIKVTVGTNSSPAKTLNQHIKLSFA